MTSAMSLNGLSTGRLHGRPAAATVSFEVTALGGDPLSGAGPMVSDWPPVSGRQLHIPTCPPTTEDLHVQLDPARAR
jgi:hypothetical protein